MNILNSKQTILKDEFSYFKINSIGYVTGYDAINIPAGMEIFRPDGYIYGYPTKQENKNSVFFAKNETENIYKIAEIQVIENQVNFGTSNNINNAPIKITGYKLNSSQAVTINLNEIMSGFYQKYPISGLAVNPAQFPSGQFSSLRVISVNNLPPGLNFNGMLTPYAQSELVYNNININKLSPLTGLTGISGPLFSQYISGQPVQITGNLTGFGITGLGIRITGYGLPYLSGYQPVSLNSPTGISYSIIGTPSLPGQYNTYFLINEIGTENIYAERYISFTVINNQRFPTLYKVCGGATLGFIDKRLT